MYLWHCEKREACYVSSADGIVTAQNELECHSATRHIKYKKGDQGVSQFLLDWMSYYMKFLPRRMIDLVYEKSTCVGKYCTFFHSSAEALVAGRCIMAR